MGWEPSTAEQGAHQQDVIVDGFGDADDGAGDAAARALLLDRVCARIAAVAAHDEHHVDRPHVYPLHDLLDVRAAPRRALRNCPRRTWLAPAPSTSIAVCLSAASQALKASSTPLNYALGWAWCEVIQQRDLRIQNLVACGSPLAMLRSARNPQKPHQDGAALQLDALRHLAVQHHGLMPPVIKALVAIPVQAPAPTCGGPALQLPLLWGKLQPMKQ